MPYEQSDQKLNELIDECLQDTELREAGTKWQIPETLVRRNLIQVADQLWSNSASYIAEYDEIEKTLHNAQERLAVSSAPKSPLHQIIGALSAISLGIFIVGVLVYIYFSFSIGWSACFFVAVDKVKGNLLLLLIFSFLPLKVIAAILNQAHSRSQQDLRTRLAAQLGITELEQRHATITSQIDNNIARQVIKPVIRSIMNQLVESSDSHELSILDAPGLSEVLDPANEVPTESKERVHALIAGMPGGSIGIAGPRGSGKSTLLQSLCRPSSVQINGRSVLSVMISAPVEYSTRDFLLHVFSTVCCRLLQLEGEAFDVNASWEDMRSICAEKPRRSLARSVYSLLGPSGLVLATLLGQLFVFFSLSFGLSIAKQPSPLPAQLSTLSLLLNTLDISLGTVLVAGILLVTIGVIGFYGWIETRRSDSSRRPAILDEMFDDRNTLAATAKRWLFRIKFQQSYSSGWSGSLKLPVVESSIETAVSLAKNQLSLPEIVEAYRDFLKTVTQKYETIIGIDELDKIEAPEKAHRFLNEIKAIFGIERCFYLISISESAMSSFERRGLPFRDTFDSSFDSIVPVGYLNINTAERLIKHRVMALPVPFINLLHSMSGGLARDLIRVGRELLQYRKRNANVSDLSNICKGLVTLDLRAKLQAVSIGLKEVADDRLTYTVLQLLGTLESNIESLGYWDQTFKGLDSLHKTDSVSSPQTEDEKLRGRLVESFKLEIASYIYYCSTLVAFFSTESLLRALSGDRERIVEPLARARQLLATNPLLSQASLRKLRDEFGLNSTEIAS